MRTAKDYAPNSEGIYELKSGYPQKTVPETDVSKYGIYLQNEYSLGDLEIIGGIRYDYYDLDSNISEVTSVDFDGYDIPRLTGRPEKRDLT